MSSLTINKIDVKNKTGDTILDLTINRRLLSPLDKLDPKKNNSRNPFTNKTIKVPSNNKPHVPHTPNKLPITTKAATTMNMNKNKTITQQPKEPDNKTPSPRAEKLTMKKCLVVERKPRTSRA